MPNKRRPIFRMTHDQTTPAPVEVMDPDDIVTMAKELASDPSNTLYGNMVLGIMCATIIDLRADLAKARIAHSAPAGEVEPVAWLYTHGSTDHKIPYLTMGRDERFAAMADTIETPLYTHPAPPADLVELVTILHQYRSDMKHPPTPDSRERRVAMIDAAIAKFGRDA